MWWVVQLWGAYLSVISLLGLIGSCFGEDPYVYFDWRVSYITAAPLGVKQQVIAVNGQFPGPILDVTTNWNVVVNVRNDLDEPLLLTWQMQGWCTAKKKFLAGWCLWDKLPNSFWLELDI